MQHADVHTCDRMIVQNEIRALRREVVREASLPAWHQINAMAEQRMAARGYAWWGQVQ